ncbi:wax ester synthase-like acyl-CoA acyltransferase domain-containing protein [Fennellomyces sp. T-0311]|nr:wax ester synthase-like acyl-CoA acyltransferase domain-containing protein [Fennellomyces sp. T-0311]
MAMLEHRLSGMDNFFLQIEHPRRLMTVSSLWIFDGPLVSRVVYDAIDQLCEDFPRYASVPAHGSPMETAIWSNPIGWQPHMNVEHYRLGKAPAPDTLEKYVTDMLARPFDYSKPLWELHAISGLEGEKCAFLWKAHHCLADGHGFIESLLEITSRSGKKKAIPISGRRRIGAKRPLNDIPEQIYFLLPFWFRCLLSWCCLWAARIHALWITLMHDLWVSLLCFLPARLSHHADFFYNGLQSYKKEVGWSDTIRLKDVRAVRRALGGTVNDIMVLVITRCIKGYLEEIGLRDDDFVRLFVPISQRDVDDQSFQNVVSGTWGWFSMKDLDTSELLAQVRSEMLAVKTSQVPRFMYQFFVQTLLDYFPGLLIPFMPTVNRFANIPHGVFTNMVGPTQPVEFGGKAISRIYVLPPQSGKGSLAIGLVSYCDQVNIAVLTDAHPRYPHVAESICKRFAPEFNLLMREVNMKTTRK